MSEPTGDAGGATTVTTPSTISSIGDWAQAVLAAIGAPVTQNNVDNLTSWWNAEGGAGPQTGVAANIANYNPLNVTLGYGSNGYGYDPGSGAFYPGTAATPGNNPPVASLASWDQGVAVTAGRLSQPFASGIVSVLQSNGSVGELSSAVVASGWGTSSFGLNTAGEGTVSANAGLIPGGGTAGATSSSTGAPGGIEGEIFKVALYVVFTLGGIGLVILGLARIFPGVTRTVTEAVPIAGAAAAA